MSARLVVATGIFGSIVGCAGAPPAPIATKPVEALPTPAPRFIPPDPEGARLGITAPLLLEPLPPATEERLASRTLSVATRDFVFAESSWDAQRAVDWPDDLCPLEAVNAGFCHILTVRPLAASSAKDPPLQPSRAPNDWAYLFGGDTAAFGISATDGSRIDRIDAAGAITQLSLPNSFEFLSTTHVIDLGARVLVLASRAITPAEAIDLPAGGATPNDPAHRFALDWMAIPPRYPLSQIWIPPNVKHALVGDFAAEAWRDAHGTPDGTWVVAWRELVRLPSYQSIGRADDTGVPKRTVLTRFSADAKAIASATVGIGPKVVDWGTPPVLRIFDGSCSLDGVRFDEKMHRVRGQKHDENAPAPRAPFVPTWLSPPFQAVTAAGYDAAHGEGIAIISDASGTHSIRFDALGKSLGPPTPASLLADAKVLHATLFKNTWLLAPESTVRHFELSILTGEKAGKKLSAPETTEVYATTLVKVDETHLEVARFGPLEPNGDAIEGHLATAAIDLDALTIAPWIDRPIPSPLGDVSAILAVGHSATGPLTWIAREHDGSVIVLVGLPGDTLARSGAPLFGPSSLHASARIYDLWGDSVVRVSMLTEDRLTWMGTGLSLPVQVAATNTHTEPWFTPGPIVGGGILPDSASSVQPLDDDSNAALASCDFAFATGPRRALFLCASAVSPDRPSRRAATRVLRW